MIARTRRGARIELKRTLYMMRVMCVMRMMVV